VGKRLSMGWVTEDTATQSVASYSAISVLWRAVIHIPSNM
jgi:hypothetical protein